jgi:ADP-ribosylglycohydrolase
MNLYKRVLGCLAGLALGDCLGGPTELLTRAQIQAEFGWVDHFVQAPAWHPHHILEPGRITDDTGQVLAVAHAVDPAGSLTADAVARELLLWAESAGENRDVVIGPSTRAALERLRQGESPRQAGTTGVTNGAAYRAVIPGLLCYAQPAQILEQVVEVCLPTHGTTPAISGAAAVAFAVATALGEEPRLADVISAAEEGAVAGRNFGAWRWATPLEKRIELAVRLVKESSTFQHALTALADYVGTDMLVSESVACAFGVIFLAEGDPMKAVQYGANIGGDTDTIAALAGAVCGAMKGIDAIDLSMLHNLELVNQLDLASEAGRLVGIIEKR